MHIKFVNPKADKYFDYTASGLCVESIENEMALLSMNYANTHSKEAGLSNHMNDLWYSARNSLFETLEINPMEFEIIPIGTGATAAIKKFQELIGIYLPSLSIPALKGEAFRLGFVKKLLLHITYMLR